MGDSFVVREDVSRKGLNRLHILRAKGNSRGEGGRDSEEWCLMELQARGVNAGDVQAWMAYEEEDVGMEHLRVYWRNGKESGDKG